MFTFIKGNKDDLEGRLVVFAPDIDDGPFFRERIGSFYPACKLIIDNKNPNTSSHEDLVIYPGYLQDDGISGFDIIQTHQVSSLSEAYLLLTSVGSIYHISYKAQQELRKIKQNKYNSKFDKPSRLNKFQFSDILLKVYCMALGEFKCNSFQLSTIKDLEYLTENVPFKEDVKLLGNLIRFCFNGQPIEDKDLLNRTKILIDLYFIKIGHIINERYEEAGLINRQINESLQKEIA